MRQSELKDKQTKTVKNLRMQLKNLNQTEVWLTNAVTGPKSDVVRFECFEELEARQPV